MTTDLEYANFGILDGEGRIILSTEAEWMQWFGSDPKRGLLCQETIVNWTVSCRFTGCSTTPDGPPCFFTVQARHALLPEPARCDFPSQELAWQAFDAALLRVRQDVNAVARQSLAAR
ncbi:MAG TPA: hypothetical protein VGD78_09850 [Chthoniobacterales bacterium]